MACWSLVIVHVHSQPVPVVPALARHEVVVGGGVVVGGRPLGVPAAPPVEAGVAERVAGGLVAVLGRRPRQAGGVVPGVLALVGAPVVLPRALRVALRLEGVVVVVGRVVGRGVAARRVVLPLGLAQQLLLEGGEETGQAGCGQGRGSV